MDDEKLKRVLVKLRDDVSGVAARLSQVEKIRAVARDGRDGAKGVQGDPGDRGQKGDPGRDGKDGQGLPGRDGRDGMPGPKGESITRVAVEPGNRLAVWIGQVKTLAGEIVAQRGEKGDKGDRGPKGDKGDKGDPGRDGKDGTTITKVELKGRELFVWLDGVRQKVGSLTLPAIGGMPDRGGGGNRHIPFVAEFGTRSITQNTTPIAFTAAADPTLSDNDDYIQIEGIFNPLPDGASYGVVQQENSVVINRAGDYTIELWATCGSSVNNTALAFKFGVDGSIGLGRRPKLFIRNSTEQHSLSAFGYHHFDAGAIITLYAASTKTANITVEDAVFGVKAIKFDT